MSEQLLRSVPFRFMRWRLGLGEYGPHTESQLERLLIATINQTALDAAVVFAFDGVYDKEGYFDPTHTHLYVTNDYVIALAKRHPKILFGASVNPYRKDAIAEIERCVQAGAVLMKWLPIVQNFDPADAKCIPFYEALAHYKLPLLSHTGGEKSLPNLKVEVADPRLLIPALQRGVTVIAAHCGTRSWPGERDFLPEFMRMAQDYEHCFGDTAALCLPARSHGMEIMLKRPAVAAKLLHGSDWPILSLPPAMTLSLHRTIRALRTPNWMRRDIMIKQWLGFDDAYWHRAAHVLKMPQGMV